MIKIKHILFEISAKEAYTKYVPLRDEEISIMKKALADNGIFAKVQQKTGKIKQSIDKDFLEFPSDLNDPALKQEWEKSLGRVKDIRSQSKNLEGIMRNEYGDEYVDKKLKPHYAKQYTDIIKKYTDVTLKLLKQNQEKDIKSKKAGMASARDKYREELRQWYANGKKGPQPELPVDPQYKKSFDQFTYNPKTLQ